MIDVSEANHRPTPGFQKWKYTEMPGVPGSRRRLCGGNMGGGAFHLCNILVSAVALALCRNSLPVKAGSLTSLACRFSGRA
jgi:hypothetical protein